MIAIASKAVAARSVLPHLRAGEKALVEAAGSTGSYGTALFDGVVLAANALKPQPGSHKVIFLVTDGQGTTGTAGIGEAAAAASRATSRSTR